MLGVTYAKHYFLKELIKNKDLAKRDQSLISK